MLQAQEETARLDEEVSILKEKLGNTVAQYRNAQAEIKRQLEENGEFKSRMFRIDNLSGDESISFYTGFRFVYSEFGSGSTTIPSFP